MKGEPPLPSKCSTKCLSQTENVALAWTLGCGFACIWLINSQVWFFIVFVSQELIEYVKQLTQFVDWLIFNQNRRYGVSVRPLLLLDGFLEVEVLKSLIPSEVGVSFCVYAYLKWEHFYYPPHIHELNFLPALSGLG